MDCQEIYYKLYYYDIGENTKLNFERPLLIHPHTGKESAYKKTFRNEPGYENTMGKMYRTMTDTNNYNYYSNYNLTDNKNKYQPDLDFLGHNGIEFFEADFSISVSISSNNHFIDLSSLIFSLSSLQTLLRCLISILSASSSPRES